MRYEVKAYIEIEAENERDAIIKACDVADLATVDGRVVFGIENSAYQIEDLDEF